jgi:ankyrin repeat protein
VASYHGKVAVVRYLATQPVDPVHVETRNRDGRTALGVASRQTRRTVRRLDVVRLLHLEAGASLDTMDDGGATALGSALERRDLAMLCCLLRSGATVRRADLERAAAYPDALYPLVRCAVSQGWLSSGWTLY